jgi:hypothetical protein
LRVAAIAAGCVAFPDRMIQWLIDAARPVYRCGGSAGIVHDELTGFPFAFPEKEGHLMRAAIL